MAQIRPAGPFALPGVSGECWLVRFDKAGICTSPKTRDALLDRLSAAKTSPVIFFSHGWNNDFSDATGLYARFLVEFEKHLASHPLPGPKPIFVGVIWPSVWLPSDDGPQMAGAPGLAGAPAKPDEAALREAVVRELQDSLPATTDWSRLYELLEAASLSKVEAEELAGLLKPMFSPSTDIAADGAAEGKASTDNIVQAFQAVQAASGPSASPASDDLDDVGTVGGTGGGPAGGQPAAAGFLGFLDPRWALRLTTLYLMKDRAGTVGSGGVASLLRAILGRSTAPVHLVGHSFGGKVMLSAIAKGPLSRKVQSVLLLQPAVSHLCFATTVPGREGPGGYKAVLDQVAGPIYSTFSKHDFPLHTIYHNALLRDADLGELRIAATLTEAGNPPNAYAALGGYGPRGAGEALIEPIPAPGEAMPGSVAGKRLVGIDGSKFTRIDGHGGVANPHTAWALRTQFGL